MVQSLLQRNWENAWAMRRRWPHSYGWHHVSWMALLTVSDGDWCLTGELSVSVNCERKYSSKNRRKLRLIVQIYFSDSLKASETSCYHTFPTLDYNRLRRCVISVTFQRVWTSLSGFSSVWPFRTTINTSDFLQGKTAQRMNQFCSSITQPLLDCLHFL